MLWRNDRVSVIKSVCWRVMLEVLYLFILLIHVCVSIFILCVSVFCVYVCVFLCEGLSISLLSGYIVPLRVCTFSPNNCTLMP